MLYRIGHKRDVYSCGCKFHKRALQEVYAGLMILDEEYGYERNWEEEGGYAMIAETKEDVEAIKAYIDIEKHPPEWVTTISHTGITSALFILNNEFTIIVYMPKEILPHSLLSELED